MYIVNNRKMEEKTMIEQIADKMMHTALEKSISDIHIMPKQKMYIIYFRYLGKLVIFKTLTYEIGEQLIRHFKYITGLAVGEKRKSQTGSATYKIANVSFDIRTSTICNVYYQETMVIRLLKIKKETGVIQHYFPKKIDALYRLFTKKQGMIIFSGPVDSGKTTLIHYLLSKKYNEKPIHIMTLEDPVEIINDHFLQTEINTSIGVDYQHLIKASLRHHPDILFIGEIRDEQTAAMAVRASLTGHLVVATIHAKSCEGCMMRLLELGVSKVLLKEVLTGIVMQRLIPRYCPFCEMECLFYCTHIPSHEKRLLLTCVMTESDIQLYWTTNKGKSMQFDKLLSKLYALSYIGKETLEEYRIGVSL
ncbi:general secretion pathway protein GspE [Granulicatella sp. zg-84]|nr:general secretion pathway protein GspE [Granulicatella sp. zg-84]